MTAAEVAPKIKNAKQSANGEWTGKCPISAAHTHGDAKPSLSWRDHGDRVLMSCKAGAGCKNADIMAELGLTLADLFHHPKQSKPPTPSKKIVAVYPYRDEHGVVLHETVRYEPKEFRQRRPGPAGSYIWSVAGSRRVVYNLDKLQGQKACAITEGERDADRLTATGLLTTTSPMGAGNWRAEYALQLKAAGIRNVVIFPDNDPDGETYEEKVRVSCLTVGLFVQTVRLPGLSPKGDVSDYLDAHTVDDLLNQMCVFVGADGVLHHPAPEVVKRYVPATFDLALWQSAGTISPTEYEPDAVATVLSTIKPVIIPSTLGLADATAEAWSALITANAPPVLFRYGDGLVRLALDAAGTYVLRSITPDRMRNRLARVAEWMSGGQHPRPVYPPIGVVNDLLSDDPPMPVLRRLVSVPVFAQDGRLLNVPGFDPQSGIYYAPPPGFTVLPVPEMPTETDVATARALILDDLLGDFPFVEDADQAAATALLLTTFCRGLFEGPVPMVMVEKPMPGTGASLMVGAITSVVLGRPTEAMTEARTEDEWRKRVTSCLMGAPAFIAFDNLHHGLDSAALSSALTAAFWQDRLLGVSRMLSLPVTCAWIGTANNPTTSIEMARRIVPCRLDAKVERPEDRAGFKHDPLGEWVTANRGELVWACLILVRQWLAHGRKPGAAPVMGSFEGWSRTLSGILDAAGIPGLLSNKVQFRERADTEGSARRAFITAWWEKFGASSQYAKDLLLLAENAEIDVEAKSDRGKQIKMGKFLGKLAGNIFTLADGIVVTVGRPEVKQDAGGSLWCLKAGVMASVASDGIPTAAPESEVWMGEGEAPSVSEFLVRGAVGMPLHARDATTPDPLDRVKCPKHPVTPRPECSSCQATT